MENLYHKIFCISLLLVLLCLFDSFNYQQISDILSFTIIFILTQTMIKNLYYSLFVSLIIFLLLRSSLTKYKYEYENFENEKTDSNQSDNSNDDSQSDDDEKKNNNISSLNNLDLKNIKGDINNNLETMIKTLSGELNPIKLSDDDNKEKNDLDENYESVVNTAIKAEDNPSSTENKNASELSPFQAQKETFELINTVQQLSETVKTLGPVLQQGKQVLDLYKHFKF